MGKRSNADGTSPNNKKAKVNDRVEEEAPALDDTVAEDKGLSYSDKLLYASAISQPMAPKKLCKRLLKLIKKAHQHKGHLRSGLKDVQTRIRKGDRGIVVFAADVTPIDVMCHLPAVCEEKDIPYCYVPMRKDISAAMGVKRPTLMALILSSGESFHEYEELYQECLDGINSLPPVPSVAA